MLLRQLLHRQHAVEVGDPARVLLLDQIQRLLRRPRALGQRFHLPLVVEEGDQGVLGLGIGLEHHLLIFQRPLLESGVLDANVVDQPSVVEDVPLERRPDVAGQRSRLEQVAESGGIQEDVARNGECGIQFGDGDPDLGALGGHLAFGAADVGTPAEQIGRDAHRDSRRRGRNAVAAEPRADRGRAAACPAGCKAG